MHNKKNQFNTTFKNPTNQQINDIHNKKHPNTNKSKYNSGGVQQKNYHQNQGINNNINNNNQINMNINNNINSINSPYVKKSHNPNTSNKNNQLEIISHQGRHNESANLNYNKMEANILEKETIDIFPVDTNGNRPAPRFGHSLVMINNLKVCIFGGAIGDTRKINYSNETYIYNILTKLWIKLEVGNNKALPQERAAHAAAVNDNSVMMIYGGSTKNGGLAEDEIWLLYLNEGAEGEGEWKRYQVTNGQSPGPRYGHSLNFIKPFFVLFGGNFNPSLSNDVWIVNINETIGEWKKIIFQNDVGPCPRLYHTSQICNHGKYLGKLIIFGGRDSNENPLNDIWILELNKEGSWNWTRAFVKNSDELFPRYNHSMIFYNDLMIIIGGRGHNSNNLPLLTQVYDMETCEVFSFAGIPMNRHSNFIYNNNVFLYGGFNSKTPTQSVGNLSRISLEKIFHKSSLLNKLDINKDSADKNKINKINKKNNLANNKSQFKLSPDVIIGSGGVAIEGEEDQIQDDQSMFHVVHIDKLTEENKRIGQVPNKNITSLLDNKRKYNEKLIEKFISTLLRPFDWFNNKEIDSIHESLPFTNQEIFDLIKEVKPLLEKDHSLIRIRSPCKIFGNIHGVYTDLMRYFESFGNPSDDNQMGDINVMQYIFLGDFCDRGLYSLEVILLLFALKVKYPDFIYLIRGHHEDKFINEKYGLGDECHDRLLDNIKNPLSIFANINKAFDYLPFGILLDNNILMVHGGIGSSINTLDDIENIKRPVSVEHNVTNKDQLHIIDLLWSEYSEDIDNIEINSERDKNKNGFIVKYGKERLNKFLVENKINLLITAHQFVKEGFTTFNNDRLLTVFSATNYMDKYKNIGGMINIAKKRANQRMNIIPKLITINNDNKNMYRNNRSPSPIRK
jgi:diadenosine tetraphosphatase ApaH/serine/threonine PP2A family protein phosphatase